MKSTEYSILGQNAAAGWLELARCQFMTSASVILIALRESFPKSSFKIELKNEVTHGPEENG
jgi:hypothetical protein